MSLNFDLCQLSSALWSAPWRFLIHRPQPPCALHQSQSPSGVVLKACALIPSSGYNLFKRCLLTNFKIVHATVEDKKTGTHPRRESRHQECKNTKPLPVNRGAIRYRKRGGLWIIGPLRQNTRPTGRDWRNWTDTAQGERHHRSISQRSTTHNRAPNHRGH